MKYLRYALVLGAAAMLVLAFSSGAWAKSTQPLVKVPDSKKAQVKKAVKKSGVTPKKAIQLSEPLDINTATKADLEQVVGIGPVLAERIIKYRRKNGPFTSKSQLVQIKGIGPESYEAFKDQVKVGRRKKPKSR